MIKYRDRAARLETRVEKLETDLKTEFGRKRGRRESTIEEAEVERILVPEDAESTPAEDRKPTIFETQGGEIIDLTLDGENEESDTTQKTERMATMRFTPESNARGRSQQRIKSDIKAEAIDLSQYVRDSPDSYPRDADLVYIFDDEEVPARMATRASVPQKRKRSQSPAEVALPPTPSSNRSRSPMSIPRNDEMLEEVEWSDNSEDWGSDLTDLSDSDDEGDNRHARRGRAANVADGTTTRIKVEETVVLPISIINQHLVEIKPLPVTTQSNLITRLAFSRACTGSTMDFIVPVNPSPSSPLPANKEGSGAKWGAVFPQTDRNPYMPGAPGEPGILFSMHMELGERTEWVVFRPREMKVKVRGEDGRSVEKKVAAWEYLGDYGFRHAGSLSMGEFRQQRDKVKWWWSQKIHKTKKWPHYVAIRARVWLRKMGREVTEEAVREVQSGLVPTAGLTVEDIIEAFERGDEAIEIWALECNRYDHAFNASLASLAGHMPTRRRSNKPRKEKKAKLSVGSRPTQGTSASAPLPAARRSSRVPKLSTKRRSSLMPEPESEEEDEHVQLPASSSTPRRSSRVPKPSMKVLGDVPPRLGPEAEDEVHAEGSLHASGPRPARDSSELEYADVSMAERIR
ncbi:hypothetical protein OE88DRAFT_1659771 [Heliocybe sulcata]|uniref:DUF6697 domain-containing protein n=1 Tax=Heliocybe sulcata TaxID=5364 RepID=A0A5C3N3Q8_9AGAM|nr:hypothetical protein OE88DRAFT_1659771 [Heliocybe sulcata]